MIMLCGTTKGRLLLHSVESQSRTRSSLAQGVALLSRLLPHRDKIVMPGLHPRRLGCIPAHSCQGRPRVPPGIIAEEIAKGVIAAADAHCSSAAIDVGATARDILALAVASHASHVGRICVHPQAAICVVGVLGAGPRSSVT